MRKTHATTEKNKNIIACIGVGIATAVAISLILTIAMTSLIHNGKFGANGNTGVFIIRTVATLVGSLLGAGLSKKNALPVIGAVVVGYFIVLLAIGLLFLDGGLTNAYQGLISVIIGGAIACLIKLKPQKSRRKSHRLAR